MSSNEVRYLPECGSTNAYVKEHFEEFGPVGAVYTTNQTAGRGRLGRSWVNAEGKALYASGERMQGYKTFEKALRADDASLALPTRQELLYSCMCCNAAFGDVETAKQFLRDMMIAGMPFDEAMTYGGSGKFMMLESSAQMRNQLIKFASGEMKSQGTVQREIFEKTRAETGTGSLGGSVGANPVGQKPQRMGDMDLMNLDIAGDTSAEAKDIAKRVVGLVVLSIAGFVGLFEAGLQFLR